MSTAGDRSSFEAIAREFLERRRRGEDISAEEYASRHPDFAAEIRRLAGSLPPTEIPGRSSGESTGNLVFELMPGERPAPIRLGDYCLIRELGRGGMGIVYEAEQESLSRRVALKVLPAGALSDSTQIRRFEREARAAARLHHTNIVPVFGVGFNEGHHYYVMQLIQGRGLDVVVDELRRLKVARTFPAAAVRPAQPPTHAARDVSAAEIARSLATERFAGADTPTGDIEAEAPVDLAMTSVGLADRPAAARPFSPPVGQSSQPEPASFPESELGLKQRVARIGVQAAEALEYAHRQGILHRDIKPANLLLDIRGNVWVTDFGLAKGVGGEDITSTGDVIGTLRYMAPERFQGEGDARSDTYALGLTLFELLSLRPAFDEQDRNRLILQVTQEDPPRLRKLDRSIPLDLETIVHKAMAREPGQRYATAGALAEDLARFVAGRPILARPISTSERMWRWCRRNPLVASLLAALMTVFLAGFLSVTALLVRTNELYEQSENRRADSDGLRIVAERRRADAESLRLESERRRAEANQQRELTRRNLYYAQMHLAQQSWFGHVGIHRMAELLDRWLPGDGKPDLRGWEWYYLKGQPLDEMVTPPSGNLADKCVAWSPDGKRLAQTARDGITLQIRDAANLREILTLRGHASVVRNLAWSPDGKRLASGDVDGLLKVWNAQNGQPIAALPAHSARIQSVAWSPDGTRIATCGLDNLIKIWDLAATHHPVTLRGHSIRPNSVSWSPDGKRLVSGGQDNLLKVWDLATKSEVLSIKGHSNPVHAVAWSPDGSRLASGSADNTARIWDAATGRELLTLKAHTGWVNSVAWQGNGARLATCGSDSTVRLWDATTGLEEQTFHGHSTPVWSVTWSPDGSQVASIGSYGVIKVWDSNREPESLALHGHRQAVMSVAWSPDGSQLASGGEDGSVKLWNAATGREVLTLSGHENWVNSVAWSPGGRHVASGSSDGTVKIWDVATGRPVHNLGGDHAGVHAVAFSPDGTQLAACSRDGTIQLLEDLDDFQKVVTFSAHADAIHSLAWSPDSKLLASGCVDGTITIWNASGHQALANLRAGGGWVSSLSWSPDGARLASACGHGINIWNVKEGRETLTLRGHTDAATGVSWSPDGLRVASTGADRSVRIWDPNTGEETLLIPGHASTAFCDVAWSPDGLRLARAGLEDVRIWDATLGYERDHSPRALPYLDRKIAAGAATFEEIEFRAAVLAEMGEWDRSGADWDRVVQLDPESQEPLLATGWWITGTDLPSTRQAEELAAPPAPKPLVSDSNSPGPASVWRQQPVTSDGELAFDVPLPQENAPLGLLRVYSSVGQPVSATFLAAVDLGIWLNGRQVHEPANTTNDKRSIRLPLILQKGWNSLVVHLARGEDQRRLSIRLTVAPADWSSTLLDSGRTEEAARLMTESVNRKPHDPRLLHAAARFHRRLGAQFRERKQPDAAQADERAACSLYAKLITQMPYDGALVSEFRDYLRSLNARPSWTVLSPTTVTSEGGATLVRLADGSILAGGKNPDKDTYTFVATTEIKPITAIRLEVLADPTLPRAGPGRHAGGNFHLTAIALGAAPSHGASSPAVIFARAIASYTRPPDHDTTPRDGPGGAIDGTHETHWDIWPQVGKTNAAYFAPRQPISGVGSMTLTFRLHFRDPVYKQVNLGRFRLSVTSDPSPLAIEHWQAAGDWIGLAGAYYAAGDFQRAMNLLESNIAPSGGDVQSWLALALCSAEVGRLPDARVWYDRALAQLREHPTSDDGIKEMVVLAMTKVAGLSREDAEVKLRSF